MNMHSGKPPVRAKAKKARLAALARRRHGKRVTPPNAWLDSGVPALIGGFAAAAAGGLSIVPAVSLAAVAGLGYTLLRMRNQAG